MRTVPGPTSRVVVVGAGLSGLAAALHLAGRGREVTVVERAPVPGGRAGRLDVDAYRLDTGPTVLTMPELVEETLAAVGDSVTRRLDLLPLSPVYEAHFADRSNLRVHSDTDAMVEEVRRFAGPAEVRRYLALRDWLIRLYRAECDRFIATASTPHCHCSPQLAKLVTLGGFGRLDRRIGRFLRDESLRRVFSFQSLYAGFAPQRALALYAMIAYMNTVAGVFFPRGGVRALPDALADAAEDAGVRLRYGSAVSTLERRGNRVAAVVTEDGERSLRRGRAHYRTGNGVPDARPHAATLVPLRSAPSAVVVHLGTRGGWRIPHHAISFGQARRGTFDELIHRGHTMSDPSLLITRPRPATRSSHRTSTI